MKTRAYSCKAGHKLHRIGANTYAGPAGQGEEAGRGRVPPPQIWAELEAKPVRSKVLVYCSPPPKIFGPSANPGIYNIAVQIRIAIILCVRE